MMNPSLYVTRSGMSSQCSSVCSSRDRPVVQVELVGTVKDAGVYLMKTRRTKLLPVALQTAEDRSPRVAADASRSARLAGLLSTAVATSAECKGDGEYSSHNAICGAESAPNLSRKVPNIL